MSRQTLSVAGRARQGRQRRGVIVVLTAFLLTVLFAFLALSVDTGRVVLTETQMQNAADAASLAASQEIQAAVHSAGQGVGSATIDANSIAVSAAREMAGEVAAANGVHIDPATDVQFGKRS
jgi:Flp pilus assembly protein TadG